MNITEAIEVLGSVRRNEEIRNDKINKLCTNPSTSIGVTAIDIALTALQEKLEMENQPGGWVPVNERLPEALGEYMVLIGGERCIIRYAENGVGWRYWEGGARFPRAIENVTHWRYLPAPPKEVEG